MMAEPKNGPNINIELKTLIFQLLIAELSLALELLKYIPIWIELEGFSGIHLNV